MEVEEFLNEDGKKLVFGRLENEIEDWIKFDVVRE